MTNAFPKYLDSEYNLTKWLMRGYETDFGHTLNNCKLLQITQLLKNSGSNSKSTFCWTKLKDINRLVKIAHITSKIKRICTHSMSQG